MSEPGAARFEAVDEFEGLVYRLVHGMRRVAERIEDEFVEAFEQSDGRFRDGAEVRQIRSVAKAKTQDVQIAMNQRNWRDGCAEKSDRAVDVMDFDERNRADFRLAVEDVRKRAAQDVKCFGVRENRQCGLLAHIERANVVESENVIGMGVREEDSVKTLEADAKGLLAKVRRRVNDDVLAIAREKQGRAETIVARIFRSANAATAAERGDAHRCA